MDFNRDFNVQEKLWGNGYFLLLLFSFFHVFHTHLLKCINISDPWIFV